MMNRSPAQMAFAALGIMLAAFVVTYLWQDDFSVAIMMLIAAAGFLTIVAVMNVGLTHGESPVAASDSDAVARWNERVAKRAKAVEPVEESSDDADSAADDTGDSD